MTLKILVATLTIFVGVLIGMTLSDVATLHGFPHKQYLVEMVHEQTPLSDFSCTKLGGLFGANLSELDNEQKRQGNCFLVLYGEKNQDGSFEVYFGKTWYDRYVAKDMPGRIPRESIKEIRPFGLWR